MQKKSWWDSIYLYQLDIILKGISLVLGGKLNVKLEKPLNKFQRIIEVATTQVRFTNSAQNHQSNNYLGLLTNNSSISNQPEKNSFTVEQPFNLKQNNAEVLILSDSAQLQQLWFFGQYKHAQYVFYTPTNFIALISGLLGLLKNSLFRRIKVVGFSYLEDDEGRKQPSLIIKILKRVTPNARRYISPVLGVENWFKILSQKQVRYTILRWFEDLPAIMPGEDIDLLVADEDLATIETLIQQQPGIIPCDLYTVSGLPGTAYKNMAYYPPPLAKTILDKSLTYKQHFRVPEPEIHFYSLAYHAIYHKGKNSGIPLTSNRQTEEGNSEFNLAPEHEYRQILSHLAQSLGIEVEISIESLDNFLDSINWRPAQDTLARLDSSEIWLNNQLSSDSTLATEEITQLDGLAVFFVRQKALELKLEAQIIQLLVQEGFSLIETKILTPAEVQRVKSHVRGGNWGKGPWAESGGEPAMVLVAVDLMPLTPTREDLVKQPHLSNGRIMVKQQIRDLVNQSLPLEQQCNTIHSSDNEREAWNYLQIASPEKCGAIKHKIIALRHDFVTNYPVQQVLTRYGRRAKVELIEYQDQLAVKKTFRPGLERFFQRELLVCQSFDAQCRAIPTLLDYGANYLIYAYYDDVLSFQERQSKLLPLSIAKQALDTLNFFYERGYALIDFQPANIIVDRHSGLKVIDFEFLYQYKSRPNSLAECYELAGIPDNFEGDLPNFQFEMSYEARWKPYVGLSLNSLLDDPVWLQYVKRFGFAITHLPIRAIKKRLKTLLSDDISRLNFLLRRV